MTFPKCQNVTMDYSKIELLQKIQQLKMKAVVRLSATSCRFMRQMNWLQIQLLHFLQQFKMREHV